MLQAVISYRYGCDVCVERLTDQLEELPGRYGHGLNYGCPFLGPLEETSGI